MPPLILWALGLAGAAITGRGLYKESPRDDLARARAEAMECRLRAALAPAEGRALRREPEPAAALLSVPGDPEAVAAGLAGLVPQIALRHRHRSGDPRLALR